MNIVINKQHAKKCLENVNFPVSLFCFYQLKIGNLSDFPAIQLKCDSRMRHRSRNCFLRLIRRERLRSDFALKRCL